MQAERAHSQHDGMTTKKIPHVVTQRRIFPLGTPAASAPEALSSLKQKTLGACDWTIPRPHEASIALHGKCSG